MSVEPLRREGRRYIVREQLRPAIHPAILLGCATTWRWWNAWLMAGTPQLATITYHLWPTLGATGVIVARTAFEDATLQAELDGYAAYAQGVRHRLLPGVW
jgi:hypothetical protein